MFFLFSKLLEFLIEPVMWILILLLLAVFSSNAVRRKRFLIATLLVYCFFTNNFIVNEFMHAYEYPAVADSQLAKTYDIGIVLGGMMSYDPKLKRVQFDRGSDRLFQGLNLYHEGRIKKILVVGGSGSLLLPGNLEAPVARNYLIAIGVPPSDILIESRSRNTHENAMFAKPILDSAAPGGNYLLITSASHMPRAYRCFLKAGVHTDRFSVDRYSGSMKFQFDYMFLPDKSALQEWDVLLHEWMGDVCYKLLGYI